MKQGGGASLFKWRFRSRRGRCSLSFQLNILKSRISCPRVPTPWTHASLPFLYTTERARADWVEPAFPNKK